MHLHVMSLYSKTRVKQHNFSNIISAVTLYSTFNGQKNHMIITIGIVLGLLL